MFYLCEHFWSRIFHVLPPLRFHCEGGCWDWTQKETVATLAVAVRNSNHSTRFRPFSHLPISSPVFLDRSVFFLELVQNSLRENSTSSTYSKYRCDCTAKYLFLFSQQCIANCHIIIILYICNKLWTIFGHGPCNVRYFLCNKAPLVCCTYVDSLLTVVHTTE
jgi:hypothetical protein